MGVVAQRKMMESLKKANEALKNRPKNPRPTKKFRGPPPKSEDSDEESDGSASDAGSVGTDVSGGPGVVANHVEIDWPATVLMIGKKFCGKTNCILNIIGPVKKQFDNIYVITTTKHKNNLNEVRDFWLFRPPGITTVLCRLCLFQALTRTSLACH